MIQCRWTAKTLPSLPTNESISVEQKLREELALLKTISSRKYLKWEHQQTPYQGRHEQLSALLYLEDQKCNRQNVFFRSHSPKAKNTQILIRDDAVSKPSYDLNYHARQVKHALTHFKDVVGKNKLEMLHGNGKLARHSHNLIDRNI